MSICGTWSNTADVALCSIMVAHVWQVQWDNTSRWCILETITGRQHTTASAVQGRPVYLFRLIINYGVPHGEKQTFTSWLSIFSPHPEEAFRQ